MAKKIKKIVSWILLAWLIVVGVTCIVIPLFQAEGPELPEVSETDGGFSVREYVRCVDDNQEALIRRLQLIESAKSDLILSTYSLQDDESGRDVMSALMAASERGIRVRILIDGFCTFTSQLKKSRSLQALAAQKNIEIKIYNPVGVMFPARNNYRMHDKYLIADQKVYLLGGRNTKNVSLGTYSEKQDMDRDLLVYSESADGSAARLTEYFEAVWNLGVSKSVTPKSNPAGAASSLEKHYLDLKQRLPEAFGETDFRSLTMPVKKVTLLCNPIEARMKKPVLWTELTAIMGQGEDVQVQTPYIILNHRMVRDLKEIARRGNLKILTNAPEKGANIMGCADFLNNKRRLLRTGATICEYAGPHSAHVKSVTVGDSLSLIGSFNFDMRSAYLDTELMLLVDSPELNAQLRQTNEALMESSRCTSSDGSVTLGKDFHPPVMGLPKKLLYRVLQILTPPIRHLL